MCKFKLALMSFLLLSGVTSFPGCSESEAPVARTEPGKPAAVESKGPAEDSGIVGDSGEKTAPPLSLDEPVEPSEPIEPDQPAVELEAGKPAPPIAIAKWMKGEPITSFAKDSVYVVEFWATWCGPCLASMPHIAQLQTEYADKVSFIGVSAEDEMTVGNFMKSSPAGSAMPWSEVLTYRIAIDDDRKTNAAYLEAAGQDGIPCAFIVGKTGMVEWIGHPMEIDGPLKQVVAGTWSLEAAKIAAAKEREAAAEGEKLAKALNELGPEISAAVEEKDFKKAITLIDGLGSKFPGNEQVAMIRLQFLIGGGMADEANTAAKAMIAEFRDNAEKLDQLAWMMITAREEPVIDLDVAMSAVDRAIELTEGKNVSTMETKAHILFNKGQIDDAISSQEKALELCQNPRHMAQLEKGLKKFQAAKSGTPEGPETTPAAVTEVPTEETPVPAADATTPAANPEVPVEVTPEPAADATPSGEPDVVTEPDPATPPQN